MLLVGLRRFSRVCLRFRGHPVVGARASAFISPRFRLGSWERLEHGMCLLLQYLLQSCSRGGRGIVEDMCYERRRAEAFEDKSAHQL